MASSPEFRNYLEDLFALAAPAGPVTIRRMFSSEGVFRDGLMIGLVSDDVLYLKADEATRPDFEAAGSDRFVYTSKGKPIALPYWTCPAEVMEDPDDFAAWAGKAFEAAVRAAACR